MSALLLFGAGVLLAFVNGANDVSKGIATLVGSGVASPRAATLWGVGWTAAGGLASAAVAGSMVAAFGHGLLSPGIAPSFSAGLASLAGAAGWVLFASRTGLPVSTTHAIVGAVAGVGALAYGLDGVAWGAIGSKLVLPLALGPLASAALCLGLLGAARLRGGPAAPAADCVCAQLEPEVVGAGDAAAMGSLRLEVVAAPARTCELERPAALRLTVDHLHWLTSGATSFARALNDAPKIAALVLAAGALGASGISGPTVFAGVTAGMVAGSLLGGRRVTAVLARDLATLDHHEGFAANLVTAALVTAGAVSGLPMSTTHVAAGGIAGAGLARGGRAIDLGTVRRIGAAWVVTVPASAALGAAAYLALVGVAS